MGVVLGRNFIKEFPCYTFGGRVGVRFVGGHLLDGLRNVAELRWVMRVIPRVTVPNHNEIFYWNFAFSWSDLFLAAWRSRVPWCCRVSAARSFRSLRLCVSRRPSPSGTMAVG